MKTCKQNLELKLLCKVTRQTKFVKKVDVATDTFNEHQLHQANRKFYANFDIPSACLKCQQGTKELINLSIN